jgi:hypothetical protein
VGGAVGEGGTLVGGRVVGGAMGAGGADVGGRVVGGEVGLGLLPTSHVAQFSLPVQL